MSNIHKSKRTDEPRLLEEKNEFDGGYGSVNCGGLRVEVGRAEERGWHNRLGKKKSNKRQTRLNG